MPTQLSDKYLEVFDAMESSEDEDKSQMVADEFARAIEEAVAIVLAGDLSVSGDVGFGGNAPIPAPAVVYDDGDIPGTLETLITALSNLGLIS